MFTTPPTKPLFGAKTNSSNGNPFAPISSSNVATHFGAPTGATMFSGNSTAFAQSMSNNSPVFGQTPGSFSSVATPFGASTGAATFSGNMTTFAQSTSNSSPVFGQTPGSFSSVATPFGASTGAATFSGNMTTFAQSTSNSSPVFGQTPGSFNSVATPFGASTGAATFSGNMTTFAHSTSNSSPVFGQTPGSFSNVATPFGASTRATLFSGNSTAIAQSTINSSPVFGQTPGSFCSVATPFGASTGATMFSGNSTALGQSTSNSPFRSNSVFGQTTGSYTATPSSISTTNSSALGQLANNSTFGTRSIFGQTNNSSNHNPFGTASAPFGTSTGASMFSGNSIGVFGAPSFAFGSSALSTTTHLSAFGTSSSFSTGASVFNKNAGSLFQPSQSTSANHAFNSSSQSGFGSGGALASGTSTIFGTPSNFNSVASNHEPLKLGSIVGQPSSQFGSNNGPTSWETKRFPSSTHPTTRSMKFGQSALDGGQRRGSRIESYLATKAAVGDTVTAEKLFSISAMPVYKDKSHEELRFEDSQVLGNKDLTGLSTSTTTAVPSFPPASTSVPSSETAFGFIGLTGNKTLSFPYQISEPSAGKTNSFTGPNFATPHSQPETSSATSTRTGLWGNLFSSNPSQLSTSNQFSESSAGRTNTFISPNVVTPHSQPQTSSAISTGTGLWGNLFSSTPSLVSTSNGTGFTWTKHEQFTTPQITPTATHAASACISEQSLAAMNAGTCQSTQMQQSESLSTMALKPSVVASPFGMESRLQISSVGCPTSSITVQYGISCIPVADKPAPIKRNSLLTARHLSLGRNKPLVEKYQPKSDRRKVPFYEEKLPGIYKIGASFIPRENPRSWVLSPMMEGPLKTNSSNSSLQEEKSIDISETGNSDERNKDKIVSSSSPKCNINSKQADEVSDQFKDDAEVVESILPKLKCPDYYTKPRIQDLAAKERARPGSCRNVKDFVVGRESYGSIRFLGETDIRNLDLESLIQFNYREVIVYMDTSIKPEVGQGLNKPAEVTLLNVKCIDKNTGKQYVDGSKINKWRNMLIKKAVEQGAEFVSYDPVIGEWKFRVQHF